MATTPSPASLQTSANWASSPSLFFPLAPNPVTRGAAQPAPQRPLWLSTKPPEGWAVEPLPLSPFPSLSLLSTAPGDLWGRAAHSGWATRGPPSTQPSPQSLELDGFPCGWLVGWPAGWNFS